ncbi:hypothetical protein QE382_002270 [Sphingobacterium zeae]|uniref:DUF4240 domain-containing protein n=1 Tax=Sphingobacterium zeae TaxID=1776859 RepID=A0ABU0U5N8_9SPHI|nr:hypothetical protein [Sphingobacterium zeae]MDQ1150286.1 hypothetical protein [Sphingobacterium zeae]
MTVVENYKTELDLVRQNPQLLYHYRFDKDAIDSKHFDRLRLNIAIYNDLKQTDYEIVKYLFNEEKEWRKYGKDGEVDNLYFCAFILTLFNSPETVWLFFEAKNIDFDSGIGFDGEYLVSAGIKETYQYLKSADNPKKTELLKYIGETEESCIYSQEDIDDWKEHKKSYFKSYKFPIQDELYFLYSTDERELFLKKLPEWIDQERAWTCNELSLYRTYAKYADDKVLEIEAFKLTLKKNDKDFLTDIYNRQLAELYVETGENTKALEILERIINAADNRNIVRDCIEQLCRIIISANSSSDEIAKQSYHIIKVQYKKYRNFSPMVDGLIKDVTEIMGEEKITAHNSNLPKAGRQWWQRLFGSE